MPAVCSSSSSSASSEEDKLESHGDERSRNVENGGVRKEEDKEAKRERKRNRVCQEIMSTELTYQNHISLIVRVRLSRVIMLSCNHAPV